MVDDGADDLSFATKSRLYLWEVSGRHTAAPYSHNNRKVCKNTRCLKLTGQSLHIMCY